MDGFGHTSFRNNPLSMLMTHGLMETQIQRLFTPNIPIGRLMKSCLQWFYDQMKVIWCSRRSLTPDSLKARNRICNRNGGAVLGITPESPDMADFPGNVTMCYALRWYCNVPPSPQMDSLCLWTWQMLKILNFKIGSDAYWNTSAEHRFLEKIVTLSKRPLIIS